MIFIKIQLVKKTLDRVYDARLYLNKGKLKIKCRSDPVPVGWYAILGLF